MLFQTAALKEGDSSLFMCDTIMYKGEPWLVLSWLPRQGGEPHKPERIVRLGAFPHQVTPQSKMGNQYSLRNPLPKILFSYDPLPKEIAEHVVDRPDVSIQIGHS